MQTEFAPMVLPTSKSRGEGNQLVGSPGSPLPFLGLSGNLLQTPRQGQHWGKFSLTAASIHPENPSFHSPA